MDKYQSKYGQNTSSLPLRPCVQHLVNNTNYETLANGMNQEMMYYNAYVCKLGTINHCANSSESCLTHLCRRSGTKNN